MRIHQTLCPLLLISLILPTALEARSWKEVGTQRTLEGEYSRTEGDQVVIILSNGNSVRVPLTKLTDEDKRFVAEQATAKPQAVTTAVFKWETDMKVAKKRAKEENKNILANFTGSDWCGYCVALKKEVFDQPEFQEYAKKHLVMLELDFPRKKELPAKQKEQNDELYQEFKVEGFPTVLIINAKGKVIEETGYQKGGPAKYVEHLKELLK